MSDRDHLSIGEVLNLLQDEFPDITVSKIRFLESRGLIAPERTPSGYRKFYDEDVERLRWILTQQKEHFLPLRVIRARLDADDLDLGGDDVGAHEGDLDGDEGDDGARAGRGVRHLAAAPGPAPPADTTTGEVAGVPVRSPVFGPREHTPVLTLAELAERTGLTGQEVRSLERLGLLTPTTFGDDVVYGDEAVAVADLAGRFKEHGIEGRHLRMYKVAAEREAGLYEQLLAPLLKRPTGQAEARERAEELASLGEQMRTAMLRAVLRPQLGD